MEKNKHLNIDDRHFIENSLNQKMSYASIANALGKDPTTISKEVKSHSILSCINQYNLFWNNHILRQMNTPRRGQKEREA